MQRTCVTAYTESPWRGQGDYWVAPVTMITVGVHAGSHGPIYWADHILQQAAPAWEGVPLTLGHPEVDGQPVSVHHNAEIFSRFVIGRVTKPFYDPAKKGIRATLQVARSHPKIEQIKKIREVSVGIFGDHTQTYGSYGGKDYDKCAISMTPDHLAALPEGQGACSWADSCGIRTNSQLDELREIAGETITRWVNDTLKGAKAMEDYPNEAVYPVEFYTANAEKDELATLAAWEGNPGPVPMEVLELRRKHADRKQGQGRGQGHHDQALYPAEVK